MINWRKDLHNHPKDGTAFLAFYKQAVPAHEVGLRVVYWNSGTESLINWFKTLDDTVLKTAPIAWATLNDPTTEGLRSCKAVQYSDSMVCEACGLSWDTNDAAPPPCDPTIMCGG